MAVKCKVGFNTCLSNMWVLVYIKLFVVSLFYAITLKTRVKWGQCLMLQCFSYVSITMNPLTDESELSTSTMLTQ